MLDEQTYNDIISKLVDEKGPADPGKQTPEHLEGSHKPTRSNAQASQPSQEEIDNLLNSIM